MQLAVIIYAPQVYDIKLSHQWFEIHSTCLQI